MDLADKTMDAREFGVAISPPVNEADRLAALRCYAIMDTEPEAVFDELTRLAAHFCNMPMASVGLVDGQRIWFKSKFGLKTGQIPRNNAFFTRVDLTSQIIVIEDIANNEAYGKCPPVVDGISLHFYAGVPLINSRGHILGAFCVMDSRPRRLTPEQLDALRILGHQIMTQLELRKNLIDRTKSNSEQQRVEQALKDANAFYHSLVEGLPQNIFRKDVHLQFTFGNQRFCQIVGHPLSAIIGKTDFDFFPEELARKFQRDDQRVMETGENLDTVEANQTPDGNKIYVHVVKTPIRNSEGQVIGIQGIFWDVTARIMIEQQLAHERDLLRTLLDNTPDHVYFKDADSRFIKLSRSLSDKFKLESPEAAVGKTDFDFFTEEHARQAFEDEQAIVRTNEPMIDKPEKETWPDGHETWALTTKMPFRNKDGFVVGTFGISKDITALEKAKAELQLARDTALESTRLKSEFLANMSHEIRTPMNAIIGMTGLLLEMPLSGEQRDFVDTIRSSADSLLMIINDILDFSKIEAGKMVLEAIDFNLVEIMEGTVELVVTKAHSKGIELVSWIRQDVPSPLRGDPGRLRQILANLLSNAVKFTHQGEVVILVEKDQETETQVQVRFSIKDTGIGIPPETQQLIFQSFTQADGSTTRKYGGTGLGLAISKQLVELMHGHIGVASEVGKGSTFWFTVRLEKQAAGPLPQREPQFGDLAGVRVLIVDDNATNRRLLSYQLGLFRMANDQAASGKEALQMLRQAAEASETYTLVILDHQMPEMDGLTLAQRIKADPALGRPRLIMLTSLGHRLEGDKARNLGLAAYLVKPVKQSRLFDSLANVLGFGITPNEPGPAIRRDTSNLEAPASTREPLNLRILVAEDNPVNQKVIVRQLKKLGLTAESVANGLEVLDTLRRIPYDVVLMDCQMPEMDGYEAARKIRAREAAFPKSGDQKPCYIVALTANALEGDRQKCLEAGMNDYIGKPVHLSELHAALKKAALPFATAPAPVQHLALAAWRDLGIADSPEAITELLDLFKKDGKMRIRQMETAAAGNDRTALLAAAHSLKGSSSNMGARPLAAQCAELEKAARAGELERSAQLLQAIRREFECVLIAVEQQQDMGAPPVQPALGQPG